MVWPGSIGNIVGGKVANKNPLKALFGCSPLQAMILVVVTLPAHHTVLSLVTIFHPWVDCLCQEMCPAYSSMLCNCAGKTFAGNGRCCFSIQYRFVQPWHCIGRLDRWAGSGITARDQEQHPGWAHLFVVLAIVLTWLSASACKEIEKLKKKRHRTPHSLVSRSGERKNRIPYCFFVNCAVLGTVMDLFSAAGASP